MLNLKKSVVDEHWRKTAPRMAKVLAVMEGVEFWLVDDAESVNTALNELAKKMENSTRETLVDNAEALIFVMAYMASGRALRMMNWFDERFPKGLAIDIVQEAKNLPEAAHARLLLDRLQTIKSLTLMNKVFAPNRTRVILEMLKSNSNRGGGL